MLRPFAPVDTALGGQDGEGAEAAHQVQLGGQVGEGAHQVWLGGQVGEGAEAVHHVWLGGQVGEGAEVAHQVWLGRSLTPVQIVLGRRRMPIIINWFCRIFNIFINDWEIHLISLHHWQWLL